MTMCGSRIRPVRAALVALSLVACGTAFATDDAAVVPPAGACDAGLKVPKLATTRAGVWPDTVWAHKESWEAAIRFRLDDDGAPVALFAKVSGTHDDPDLLARITTETVGRYRFCLPADFSTTTVWTANVRFLYRHVTVKAQDGEMYIQMFAPNYTHDDIAQRRTGKAKVAATFGQDGKAFDVRLTETSGDRVLDDKSINAVSSYQLAFHDDTVRLFPVTFEHPISYEIR